MPTEPHAPTRVSHSHLKNTAKEHGASSHATKVRNPTRNSKESRSFEATMADISRLMPVPQHIFSTMIHTKAVESISDILGSTLARPNALLLGAFFSFALSLPAYILAKNLGYSLSGFESVGAFIIGWLIGLLYDFLKRMVTGKQ